MFRAVELNQKLGKKTFKNKIEEIRTDFVKAEIDSRKYPGAIIILLLGVDGAGKGDLVNFLGSIMDIRNVEINTFWKETDEDNEHPEYWRYFRALPSRGQIGIFFGAWYSKPMMGYVSGKINELEFEHELGKIAEFENMLAQDNAVIIKFWMHLSQKEQKKKLKSIKDKIKDPKSAMKRAMWHYDNYDKIINSAEKAIRNTDRLGARWFLVEATDKYHSQLKVVETLNETFRNLSPNNILSQDFKNITPFIPAPVLKSVNLNKKLEDSFDKLYDECKLKINALSWEAYNKKISTVVVFEGWDAAGKGGAIRRLTSGMDVRLVQVKSIAAPTDEEKAHHYLWRFWRHLPRFGYTTIYDRSWYGRVLVERVENFAKFEEWNRSYEEINSFENHLVTDNTVLMKFWLHISPEEQLKRFEERQNTGWKNYKITDEDWRNREKFEEYEKAADEMLVRTSTSKTPWYIIPANDKKFARIEILKTYINNMEKALKNR